MKLKNSSVMNKGWQGQVPEWGQLFSLSHADLREIRPNRLARTDAENQIDFFKAQRGSRIDLYIEFHHIMIWICMIS